jgi:hypothetical protein
MENAPKALYNSLRIRVLEDPSLEFEPWQVEDLRLLTPLELFTRLSEKAIVLDKARFIAFANEYDSPEELTEALIPEEHEEEMDFVYLLIFELWRRFVPEKQTISLICDELDYQIFLYDTDALETLEPLDDAISTLYSVLKENVDQGTPPVVAFTAIQEYCAHDLVSFLYDYILQLIDGKEYSYAGELVEQFYPFLQDKTGSKKKWFDFLLAQIRGVNDPRYAFATISKVLSENEPDLLLSFDILEYLAPYNHVELVSEVTKRTLPIVTDEEDLQELCYLLSDYFGQHGCETLKTQVNALMQTKSLTEKKKQLLEIL